MRELTSPGIRGESEFFRRVNNRTVSRQKRIRTIQIKGIHLFLVLLVMVLVGYFAYSSGKFLLTWEKLDVRHYQVVNSPRFSEARVQQVLKRYRGNILTLDFEKLRRELLEINEVNGVSISKRLPATVVVNFSLRQPRFQYLKNKTYQVMDAEGVALYSSAASRPELITLKNLNKSQLDRMVPYLKALNPLRGSVKYIGLDGSGRVVLKIAGVRELIYPPKEELASRLELFLKAKKSLGIADKTIRYVDLRFKNRFYFEFEKEAGG